MNYQIIYSMCSQTIKPRRRKNIMQKLLKNHITKLRFGIIGAINTILDIGILFALSGIFSIPKVPANIISTTVTFVISFFANRKYTFKPASSQHIVREMILFTGITLFGLWVIQGIIINVLTPSFMSLNITGELALLYAKLIATGASMVWNYILYSRIVFRD